MALKRQTCQNHPDRPAVGVCVITHQAICAECSTRYEGVNYSREGLGMLQQRRAAATAGGPVGKLVSVAVIVLAPLMVWLAYLSFYAGFSGLIDLIQLPGELE